MTGVQASVYPDPWQDIVASISTRGQSATLSGAGTYIVNLSTGVLLASNAAAGTGVFHFDPSWYALTAHDLQLRCIWSLNTNDVAPTISFTFGLYPVTAVAGASGANSTITLGTVVTGTTATFTTPAADLIGTSAVTSAITAPSAGLYIPGFTITGADASGASVVFLGRIQVRNVHT